ncbi:hypothetical protein ACJ41O_014424 [Fusarium nematophilum]
MPPNSLKRSSYSAPALAIIFTGAFLYFIWAATATAKPISGGSSRNPPPSFKMATGKPISVLSLSQNRAVVRSIDDHITPHGYGIGGILESDPFSTHDLAVALRVLEPRPRAVVVGRGYTEEEADEVPKAFAEYSKDVGLDTGVVVIKITDEVFDKVGKEGVPKWVPQHTRL